MPTRKKSSSHRGTVDQEASTGEGGYSLDSNGGFMQVLHAAFQGEQSVNAIFGRGEKVCPAYAYLDLLSKGARSFRNHEIVTKKGYTVRLKPHQFLGVREYYAKRWNWHASNVRNFLERLVKAGEICVADGQSTAERRARGTVYELRKALRYLPKSKVLDSDQDNTLDNRVDWTTDTREEVILQETTLKTEGERPVVQDERERDAWVSGLMDRYPEHRLCGTSVARSELDQVWHDAPSLEETLQALEMLSTRGRWKVEHGRYVPRLDRWIRDKGWLQAHRLDSQQRDWEDHGAEDWLDEVSGFLTLREGYEQITLEKLLMLPFDALRSPEELYDFVQEHGDDYLEIHHLVDSTLDDHRGWAN